MKYCTCIGFTYNCKSNTHAKMKHISSTEVLRDCVSTTIEYEYKQHTLERYFFAITKIKIVWYESYEEECKSCWLFSGCRSSG